MTIMQIDIQIGELSEAQPYLTHLKTLAISARVPSVDQKSSEACSSCMPDCQPVGCRTPRRSGRATAGACYSITSSARSIDGGTGGGAKPRVFLGSVGEQAASSGVERLQARRLDGRIESTQRVGDLAFFNRSYRAYRLDRVAHGEHARSYAAARSRLKRSAAGKAPGAGRRHAHFDGNASQETATISDHAASSYHWSSRGVTGA